MVYDPWCSSGGLAVDGTLVGTGGWDNGVKTVRYMKPCDSCDFKEYQTTLADPRWYFPFYYSPFPSPQHISIYVIFQNDI